MHTLLPLQIARTPDAVAAVRDEWLELMARSAHDEPMRSPLWLEPWWRVFGALDGRTLTVGLWRERGRLVGVAPFLSRRVMWRGALPFSRVEPLGSGEAQEDEVCSDYLGLVAERGAEATIAEAFADGLERGAFGACDELLLPAMIGPDVSDESTLLAAALRRRRWEVEVVASEPAPYTPLPASFDAYLSALGQERRYKLRRALRDFDKWTGGKHVVHIADSPASLARGFDALASLHGERWGAERAGGAFGSPRFRAFHQAATQTLLERKALELSWITVEDRAIVALYNIVWAGRVHFYQSGRLVDVPKGVKPGIVGHALAMQRAIAAGHREYDFLAGTSRYKSDLALAERPIVNLRAARPTLRERVRRLAQKGIDELRRLRATWR